MQLKQTASCHPDAQMRNTVRKSGSLLVCLLLILAIPQIASLIASKLVPRLSPIDPDGTFLWATVHHIAQLLLTLLVAPVFRLNLTALGFNLNNRQASLSLLRTFILYFVVFVVVGHIILYFTSPAPNFSYPLTFRNVIGELGFKAILSGTAEEPLFRGLVMMVLYRSWHGRVSWLGMHISDAGLIATVLFIIAHIGFTVVPFQVTWVSPIQLLQAGILGFFYAIAFDKTRSLLTPVLAHNFANVFLTSIGMIWSAIA
jgi:membrane protease YdiL (CAAX protease family)